jgi:hypothetical protein
MQNQQNSIINNNLLNAIHDYLRTQPHANVDGLIQGIRQCQPNPKVEPLEKARQIDPLLGKQDNKNK